MGIELTHISEAARTKLVISRLVFTY